MAKYQGFGFYFFILIAFSTHPISVKAEVKSASACYGTAGSTCTSLTLECNPGARIRLLAMKYGVKTYDCDNNNKRSRCLDPDSDGCCVPRTDDCMEYYSDLHAYNLYRECSGKQSCGPMQVPYNILRSCDGKTSTYVHITYECLAASDSVTVSLCRENDFNDLNGDAFNVIFNSTVDVFTRPSACSCFISSNGAINIDYVDIRMTKTYTTNFGSDCCSASLSTVPDDDIGTTCDNGVEEEGNFVYSVLSESNGNAVEVKLTDLYRNGDNDAPEFIWLYINAKDQEPVDIQCFKHVTLPPTTSGHVTGTGVTSSSSPPDVTRDSLSNEDDSNTGAIVTGILVPIILLLLIGAIVAFIVWKRRGYLFKKTSNTKPNRNTDSGGISNSVDNEEYAEIGFVPDQLQTEPYYDPVYESKKKTPANDLCNGHGYQNVGTVNKSEEKPSRKPKKSLGNIKAHTTRLISFFRNQHANDFSQGKNKDKDVSDQSYDHLRPTSANLEVTVNIIPPIDEPQHTYSHTSDESVKRQLESKRQKADKKLSGEHKQQIKPKADIQAEDINAVHIGDSYIEFQSGTIDKNHRDLVRAEEIEQTRPVPPTRPPPSPKSLVGIDKSQSPRTSPKLTRTLDTLHTNNDGRPKSPNLLSPDKRKQEDRRDSCGSQKSSRCESPQGSNISDVSLEHSYKILEEQPVYDYADVSDPELAEDEYQLDSIYEDVDRDPRLASVKKHKSAADVPQEQDEYLEPITSRTRAISTPGAFTDNGNTKTEMKPVTIASVLRKELKEKTKQKNKTKASTSDDKRYVNIGSTAPKDTHKSKDEPKTFKSDNVDTKDYQKVDEIKGVMKMTKMFENKDSDTDSSRQSSPRNIKVTDNPNMKKKVDKSSSDV